MEGLPRPSKPMENRMSKTTAEILNQSYGLIGEANHTFGEALDHYAVVIGNATAVPKAKQESLIEASLFLASLRSQFLTDKEWGKFLKGTAIFKKLKLRFGMKNAAPEASKMLWIGAVDAKHLNGFKEANGKSTKGKPFFRCDSTSPTGLCGGINRYLEEVVGLQGEALLEASAMSTVGRAKKIAALSEPEQPKAEKPAASDPKDQATDQVEDQPKAEQQSKVESKTPVQPKAEKPTAEAVVDQLASQVEAYGFDSKDIENVLRLLTERLQPKVVQTIGKAKPKKAASKKQAAAKKAA
ncbi:MAG: hypothetical protein ACPF8W_00245 [Luminiphilus sp.]